MKIDSATGYLYASQRAQAAATAGADSAARFASAMAANTSQANDDASATPADIGQPDFSSMTRQQMRDWVNDQIRSGDMSLDESTAFVGLTLKVSAQSGQLVDGAADATRIDVTQKLRQGVEGALSRNDRQEIDLLQTALAAMLRFQGKTTGGDSAA